MKKTGAIGMGFLSLTKASEWQEERALKEGWKVLPAVLERVRMGTVRTEEGWDMYGRREKSDGEMREILEKEGEMYEHDGEACGGGGRRRGMHWCGGPG